MEDPRQKVPFDILITGYAPAYAGKVREYLKLLGLSMPPDESQDIIIPVYLSIKGRDWDGVAISTRSTFDLIEILRAGIEIPKEHFAAELAHHSPTHGLAGKNIHIHTSQGKPEEGLGVCKIPWILVLYRSNRYAHKAVLPDGSDTMVCQHCGGR